MRMPRSCPVWLLWLFPLAGGTMEPPAAESSSSPPTTVTPSNKWDFLSRLKVTTLALLPHGGMGADEGFAQVEPTLIIDGGAEFGVNLGAPVRLRLWGGERSSGQVRREDWDSLSDWGQWVRGLNPAGDGTLRPGAFASVGLGVDHVR